MTGLAPEARHFVAKWLTQEPEMEPVLGFLPAAERELASFWGALQNELFEAMVEPRDSGVTQVKLAWWGEALTRGAAQGAAHPLVRALFMQPAAAHVPVANWSILVHATLRLAGQEASPPDLASALRLRNDYAAALAQIEAALFESSFALETTRAIAAGLLLRSLRRALRGARGRDAFLPLHLFARHGLRAAEFDARHADAAGRALIADFATSLAAEAADIHAGATLRRCRTALDRALLRTIITRPEPDSALLSRWTALWTAWRAARARYLRG